MVWKCCAVVGTGALLNINDNMSKKQYMEIFKQHLNTMLGTNGSSKWTMTTCIQRNLLQSSFKDNKKILYNGYHKAPVSFFLGRVENVCANKAAQRCNLVTQVDSGGLEQKSKVKHIQNVFSIIHFKRAVVVLNTNKTICKLCKFRIYTKAKKIQNYLPHNSNN